MIRAILFVLFILLMVGAGALAGAAYGINYKKGQELDSEMRAEIRHVEAIEGRDTRQAKIAEIEEEYRKRGKALNKKGNVQFYSALICTIVMAVGTFTIPGSFHQVDTGTVAVVRRLGKIEGIRQPGTYFDFWMVQKYETYDTKVQQDKILTAAYSKDGQTMELEVFLQYQVQSENIMKIATEYGNLDALQARIETVTIEKTKAVMSSAEAMTIVQDRANFSNNVSESVREGISSDYYVNVKDVVLTNIDFTDAFERSVEDKVIAEQDKQAAITRAQAELEVAKLEAQKKIEEARGNAEAQKILAQATAEAATYKIIELSKSVGYTVNETYIYSVDGVETEFAAKQAETDAVIYLSTKYVIDITSGPGEAQFKTLIEDYLKYLAYLEVWNGELPSVVAGDDAVSILVP